MHVSIIRSGLNHALWRSIQFIYRGPSPGEFVFFSVTVRELDRCDYICAPQSAFAESLHPSRALIGRSSAQPGSAYNDKIDFVQEIRKTQKTCHARSAMR